MILHLVNRYELREVEEAVNIMYVYIEAKATVAYNSRKCQNK